MSFAYLKLVAKHVDDDKKRILSMLFSGSNDIRTLYKYKHFSKDRFRNDVIGNIWLSKNSSLNDPFDLNFHLDNATNAPISRWMEQIRLSGCHVRQGILDLSEEEMNEAIDELSVFEVILWFAGIKRQYNMTKHLLNIEHSYQWTMEFLKIFKIFIQEAMNDVGIFSLTTGWNKEIMWAYYGNNYSGYCISYSFIMGQTGGMKLGSVNYTNTIKANTNEILGHVSPIIHLAFQKSDSFKAEEEWRMASFLRPETSKGRSIPWEESGLVVSEISIGYKMLPLDKIYVELACRENQIPLFFVTPNTENCKLVRSPIFIPEMYKSFYQEKFPHYVFGGTARGRHLDELRNSKKR